MAENRAHNAEGHGGQHQQRLPVRAKRDRHQGVNHQHGQHHVLEQGRAKSALLAQFAVQGHAQAGIIALPARPMLAQYVAHHLARRTGAGAHIGGNFQHALPIQAFDALITRLEAHFGERVERQLCAVRCADSEVT